MSRGQLAVYAQAADELRAEELADLALVSGAWTVEGLTALRHLFRSRVGLEEAPAEAQAPPKELPVIGGKQAVNLMLSLNRLAAGHAR